VWYSPDDFSGRISPSCALNEFVYFVRVGANRPARMLHTGIESGGLSAYVIPDWAGRIASRYNSLYNVVRRTDSDDVNMQPDPRSVPSTPARNTRYVFRHLSRLKV